MEAEGAVNGHALTNGQARLNGTIEKGEAAIYKQENIFIFIPNIIGKHIWSSGSKAGADHLLKVIRASSLPLPLSTTCHYIRAPAPFFTVFPVSSMP